MLFQQKMITNSSGTFWMDAEGVLQKFCCSPENNADSCSEHDTKKLYTLHIPEGVTVLKEEAFRYYTVLEKLTLPDSLRLMGTGHGCVLCDCPKTLHGNMPGNLRGGEIGTLYLSQKYRDESNHSKLCRQKCSQSYLNSLVVNNVRIREIVWLN